MIDTLEPSENLCIELHSVGSAHAIYAPDGNDNFYVLMPVLIFKAHSDCPASYQRLNESLMKLLQEHKLQDLSHWIVHNFVIFLRCFRDKLLSPKTNNFSIIQNLMQPAGFLHPNRSPRLNDLYFVGAEMHLGAGALRVVMPARVVERLMRVSVSEENVTL